MKEPDSLEVLLKSGSPLIPNPYVPGNLSRRQRQLQADFFAETGITPLEFLIAVMRKETAVLHKLGIREKDVDLSARISAANQALPYLHRKQPIAVDGGAPGMPIPIAYANGITKLSDADLAKLESILVVLTEEENSGHVPVTIDNAFEMASTSYNTRFDPPKPR
jgi:hypothetical protein